MDVSREINPFAYLNYIVFDENYILKDAGAMRVPHNAGFDPGMEIAVTPQQIAFANPIRPQQKGYIYIWVSNESENTKVWFDDLKVTHRSRRVTQATDYYAYGSVLREQKTPEELTYRYKYQGQYAEKDEETGWSHFEAREYDPTVGRWLRKDPHRQFWSPYLGMGNNPVSGFDPDGRDVIVLNAPNGAGEYGHLAVLIGDDKNGWTFVSKEGRDESPWYSTLFGGGPALEPRVKTFKTLEEFHNNVDFEEYTEGARFSTTREEDVKAVGVAKESASSYYHFYGSNCGNTCGDVLSFYGFDPGYSPIKGLPTIPNDLFWSILNNNTRLWNMPKYITFDRPKATIEVGPLEYKGVVPDNE